MKVQVILHQKKKKTRYIYLVDFYFNGRRFIRSTKTDKLETAKVILKDIESKISREQFNVGDISAKKKVYLKDFIPESLLILKITKRTKHSN